MPFIHESWSLVEWIAVSVAALVALVVVIGLITNCKGLLRYLKISSM